MKNINSPEDEWSLSFISNNRAVLTFSDWNTQRGMIVKMVRENKATLESGIGIPLEGSYGAFSFQGNKAVFSAKEERIIPTDETNPDVQPNQDGLLSVQDGIYPSSNLYTAELKGNMLTNVQNIGADVIYDKFSFESHPTISSDGNVIFFASDRPNGYNGTDIWFTIKKPDGKWSKPINCGDNINSSCDELTPFITKDGKQLMFASSGHDNVGGYDIFSSDISNAFWTAVKNADVTSLNNAAHLFFGKAKNMREPLNTPADELFPTCPGGNCDSLLYYTSNQNASQSLLVLSGGFDIFLRKKVVTPKIAKTKSRKLAEGEFSTNEPKVEKEIQTPQLPVSQTYKLKGTVYNNITNEAIPEAEIFVRDLEKKKDKVDLEKERELEATAFGKDIFFDSFKTRADVKGDYEVTLEKDKEYEVTAQTNNFFFDSFKMRVESDDTTTVIKRDFYVPEVLNLRLNFPTKVFNNPYKFTLDSNGIETDKTWQEEVTLIAKNILLSIDKIQKIVIIGHTDDVGSESYNIKLAQNRVDFVLKELEKLGVPLEKLEGRSAGKSEPLIQRSDENLKLYRKRLRRVEMQKILI